MKLLQFSPVHVLCISFVHFAYYFFNLTAYTRHLKVLNRKFHLSWKRKSLDDLSNAPSCQQLNNDCEAF